jgi:hypothetical protein
VALQTTHSTRAAALLINNFISLVLHSTLNPSVKNYVIRLLYAINYGIQTNMNKSNISYFLNTIGRILFQHEHQHQHTQTTHSPEYLNAYRQNKSKSKPV